MSQITGFTITKLFGSRNISLEITNGALILVGPNGAGKSTVINIFYFFVTRQWDRLLEYDFQAVAVSSGDRVIETTRDQIFGLQRLNRALADIAPMSRPGRLINRLRELGQLEEFFLVASKNTGDRRRFAEILSVPPSEILQLHHYLMRRVPDTEGESQDSPRVELERALAEVVSGRVLYLPTYRRIEKDLKEIFPDLEEHIRRFGILESAGFSARSSGHYVDLVSFGMNDVKENVDRRMGEMRDYSLKQYNDLSATYLRDVIRGQGDSFVAKDLNELTEERITEILDRVDETALPAKDKSLLLKKVKQIQQKKKSSLALSDKFLAHYFSRLVAVNVEIGERERDITSFVQVCNAYLNPSKKMVYDEIKFSIRTEDESGKRIELAALSSGEKQIVSIFSHLYLDDAVNQVVIIDEPELSLSVPWQKRFLIDIMRSGKCSMLLAVTHSPFIYEQELRESAVDLRRATTIAGA
ncbi:AAA family ATPase [Luteimonas sp. A649]